MAAIPPSNTAPPTISGTLVDGQTLTASTGSWSGSPPLTYGYQWELCNSSGGKLREHLRCDELDLHARTRRCRRHAAGQGHGEQPGRVGVEHLSGERGGGGAGPVEYGPAAISGTARDGQTLSASTGEWAGTPSISYAYQWELCNSSGEACADIAGATSATYPLEHGDVGGNAAG